VLTGVLKAFYNQRRKQNVYPPVCDAYCVDVGYSALYNSTRASINVDCITDAGVLSLSSADREKMCSEIHASSISSLRTAGICRFAAALLSL